MTAARGRPLLPAKVDFPLVIGVCTGGGNTMASSPSKNYSDLTSSSCVQGTSLRALEPGTLSLVTSQAWADLDEDTG